MDEHLKSSLEDAAAGRATWRDVLAGAVQPDHIVQFYQHPDFLAEAVATYVADGLRRHESVILVMTPSNWQRVRSRLALDGIDIDALTDARQLTVLDAQATLSKLMVNDAPDPDAFRDLLMGLLGSAGANGSRPAVRVYGEMVNLLWQPGNGAAALALEALWNDLLKLTPFSLLCAYALDVFDRALDKDLLRGVCAGHSHVIPAADYRRFDRAVWSAIEGVMGERQSAMLRTVVANGDNWPTRM